jgi:putative transposase
MDMTDAHRLKSLPDENASLKRLLVDTLRNNLVLKDLLGKN